MIDCRRFSPPCFSSGKILINADIYSFIEVIEIASISNLKHFWSFLGDVNQSSRAKHDVKTQIELPEEISLNVPELDDNFDNEVQETCINFLKIFHHTVSK